MQKSKNYISRIILVILIYLNFTACENDELTFESEGVILGYDMGMCICCGGYFIELNGNTYRTWNFPNNDTFAAEDFPIPILLNWHFAEEGACSDGTNLIVVENYFVNQ